MAKVCQLFSGSSGNSIFISSGEKKFLVDIGVSAKKIETALSQIGEDADSINGVFVTHEHCDHIKGLRVFTSKHNVPVFAESSVIESMRESGDITDKTDVFETEKNMDVSGITITPFALSHDSVSCQGYTFSLSAGRKVGICTDTGFVTDSAKAALCGCDLVFLESNHEIRMLENGSYPYILKKRIMSDKGHLSNDACAEFSVELMETGTTRIILSHLSRENNHPDIARQTTLCSLLDSGFKENIDFRIGVSAPVNNSKPVTL